MCASLVEAFETHGIEMEVGKMFEIFHDLPQL